MRKLLLLLWVALLAGCNPATVIEKIADKEKQRIALDYIHRVAAEDPRSLIPELDGSITRDKAMEGLNQLHDMIPKEAPTVTNLVSYYIAYTSAEGVQNNLAYQFGYGSKWILVYVTWKELPGGLRQLVTLKAYPLERSLQETNTFSFRHAGIRHFLFLGTTLLIAIFILTTLVVCIRTKITQRKWVWIILILLGVVQFSFNWTTGEMNCSPMAFLVFGASAMASSVYSPWVISFALPVGATLFWFKRKDLTRPAEPPPVTDHTRTPLDPA